MKKLLLFIAFTFSLLCMVNAQNETVDRSLSYESTYFTQPLSAELTTGDSIFTYVVRKLSDEKIYPYFYIELDSLGGTAGNVNVYLQYKVFGEQTFTDLDTVTYAGSVDTSFVFFPNTRHIADYWRIYIIGASDEFNVGIDRINGKFVK